jgi:hypothetical protein
MTSRELIRWSQLHERRARTVPPVALAVAGGGLLAAWVWWRAGLGAAAASRAWLAGATVAYAVAFLRVPFHIYWRADAPLLAQLPIEGRPLFDAALVRCLRAAQNTTLAVLIGIAPLAVVTGDWELALRHAALALALAAAAGLLLPAVTLGAATLVVRGGEQLLQAATALAGAPGRRGPDRSGSAGASTLESLASAASLSASPAPAPPASSASTILGALPGFAATVVLTAVLAVSSYLLDGSANSPAPVVLGTVFAASVLGALAARARGAVMSRVLRDVSALDRQRLATLEVVPPTRIEALIARLIGDAALPYAKDARLMRRRFPMAFALGALAFGVLAIVGLARPDDPTPWLTVAIGGAAAYGIALAGRLHRPPIELARLSATLPLAAPARARAKLAWLLGWWSIYVVAPALFAALRQPDPTSGLALTGAATIVIIVAGALPR